MQRVATKLVSIITTLHKPIKPYIYIYIYIYKYPHQNVVVWTAEPPSPHPPESEEKEQKLPGALSRLVPRPVEPCPAFPFHRVGRYVCVGLLF